MQDNKIIPKGRVKQAIIFLHGYGSNGIDLLNLEPFFSSFMEGLAFYAPNGPYKCEIYYGEESYQWFSLKKGGYNAEVPELKGDEALVSFDKFLSLAEEASVFLNEYIDKIKDEYKLEDKDIYLLGLSQGGFMAIYAGLTRKNEIGGIISFSGVPLSERFNSKIRNKTEVLLNHGTLDEVIPVDTIKITEHTLKSNNIKTTCRIVAGLGHGIDSKSLNNAKQFILLLEKEHCKEQNKLP